MDKKFDKKKLGIIHPIMEKEPFQAQQQFLQERFLLKGQQMKVFEKLINQRELPNYLIKPFYYVKRVYDIRDKNYQYQWNKSTNTKQEQKNNQLSLDYDIKNLLQKGKKNDQTLIPFQLNVQKLLYQFFTDLKSRLLEQTNYDRIQHYLYKQVLQYSKQLSQPQRNLDDFKHRIEQDPGQSDFAHEIEILKNPFFITKPIFIKFFQIYFSMENVSEAEIIFDCFAEQIKGSDIPSIKQLCLFAFAFNFEVFLKSSDPKENLISDWKLKMLSNQLSILARACTQLKRQFYLDIPIKYQRDFELVLKRIFWLEKVQDLKIKDFIRYYQQIVNQLQLAFPQSKALQCYSQEQIDYLQTQVYIKKYVCGIFDSVEWSEFNSKNILKTLQQQNQQELLTLKKQGNFAGQFLTKCHSLNQETFQLQEYFQWERQQNSDIKFGSFLVKFIRKTKDGQNVKPTSNLSVRFFDEAFDFLCEKTWFKINSKNEFFDQVVQFRDQFQIKSNSPIIKEKVSSNLFFHFSLDLLYFIDNQIIEYMHNLISMGDFYHNIIDQQIQKVDWPLASRFFSKNLKWIFENGMEIQGQNLKQVTIESLPKYTYDFNVLVNEIDSKIDQNQRTVFQPKNLEKLINLNYDKTVNLCEKIDPQKQLEESKEYFSSLKNQVNKFSQDSWGKTSSSKLHQLYIPNNFSEQTKGNYKLEQNDKENQYCGKFDGLIKLCERKLNQGNQLEANEQSFYQSLQGQIQDYLQTTPPQLIKTATVSDLLHNTYEVIIQQLKKEESYLVSKRLSK